MINKLNKLAEALKVMDPSASDKIRRIAGRYDKVPVSTPPIMQHAYKYIMYLRLMKGIDDESFHAMKRKYMDCSPGIQEECRQELSKIINQDAIAGIPSSAEIRRTFEERLKSVT
jgi:hypothetical protein